MNFTLKIKRNRQATRKCQTHSVRRFLNRLRTINWKDDQISVYLKIYYGRHKDNFGKIVPFYNDGEYENKKDLWKAFNAFYDEREKQ